MALVEPHGGNGLKPLLLAGAALTQELKHAQTLPTLRVSSREKVTSSCWESVALHR